MHDTQTIRVRNLGHHAEGYWIAEVAVDYGVWIGVHRKWGSWMHGHGDGMRQVLAPVASKLQIEVKKLERKEKRFQSANNEALEERPA